MQHIEFYRTGWTLNEIVTVSTEDKSKPNNILKAVYLCYIVQYGRKPIYAVQSLDSDRVGKFEGTKEELFNLFKKYTPVRVSLTSKVTGHFDAVTPELRDKELNEQMDYDIKKLESSKTKLNLPSNSLAL